jgi:hypothetical protein
VIIPRRPVRLDTLFLSVRVAHVVDVEHKVDECVGVVHPAQTQDDRRVKGAQVEGQRLDDEGDEDGKCGDEDSCRLLLNRLQLGFVHFRVVHECVERWYEAEDVLGVCCATDADAGDVRIPRNVAHAGRERGRTAGRVRGPASVNFVKNTQGLRVDTACCMSKMSAFLYCICM